ncbi:VWA domain-containing protein [Thermodesulfobacteriota bacterium]
MKGKKVRTLLLLGCLLAVTCGAMAYVSMGESPNAGPLSFPNAGNEILHLSGQLVQDKVYSGGDGKVSLSLTLTADEVFGPEEASGRNVDMVVVLDRSGSMRGRKIEDARRAVLELLSCLSPRDRFALVTYSDVVHTICGLKPVEIPHRRELSSVVGAIQAGGSTNLGAGLQRGMNLFLTSKKNGNAGRILLISDGLANRGITDPVALGSIASMAAEKSFSISAIGVGNDFNEQLMTHIADRGTGRYHYLEDPASLAAAFRQEFRDTRVAAATSVEILVPLQGGVSLVDAAGYPIEVKNGVARILPGDVLSGQSRKLFLTFQIPTGAESTFTIKGIRARYVHAMKHHTAPLADDFKVACVTHRDDAIASIDKKEWEQKVIQEDYNKLKEKVGHDIKSGKKDSALERIGKYFAKQQELNEVIGSSSVDSILRDELQGLRETVDDSFRGPAGEAARKQKENAKALQYKGYEGRRSYK